MYSFKRISMFCEFNIQSVFINDTHLGYIVHKKGEMGWRVIEFDYEELPIWVGNDIMKTKKEAAVHLWSNKL